VAEFVSHPDILEVCREEGVDFAQGFLIGKPVPYDEFVSTFLASEVTAPGPAV
jgi:EAL domain-containing protein (putative c-di-GMP-specific phosphodiesterase class I)